MKLDIALRIRAKNGVLQSFIDERKWSQNDFGRAVECTPSEVGRWFNLQDYPRTEKKMFKVVELVGKPPEEIFPDILRDRDWLHSHDAKPFTVHREIDLECLPINQVKELPAYDENNRVDLSTDIDLALTTLTEREQIVVRMRLGFDGQECTFQEIGDVLSLSNSRCEQIFTKAVRKLKHPSRRKILEEYA